MLGFEDLDPIEPSLIEHKVDEIIIEGRIEQSYNFIDYWFDDPGGRARARVYLESTHEVSMYPPIQSGVTPEIRDDWAIREAMIAYLSRRFLVIKQLGLTGYRAIWMATHAVRVCRHLGIALDD